MDEHWTSQELTDDWELMKQAPWAKEEPLYNDIKQTASQIATQARQNQKKFGDAKAQMRSFAEDVKKLEPKKVAPKILQEQTEPAQTEPAQTGPAQIAPSVNQNPEQRPVERHQRTSNSSAQERHEDNVFVPGAGWFDRNQYDIGNVEHNDDGTYTITDMTGRRYDYPPRQSSGDSCIIS